MDATYKAFSEVLKKICQIEKGKRLTKKDWESVYSLIFKKNGYFELNDECSSDKRALWDLHHIFRFTKLRVLDITNVSDAALLLSFGIDAFDFQYWYKQFEHLNGLRLKVGSYENHKEAHCYKFKLKDGSIIYVVHYLAQKGKEYEVKIYDDNKNVLKEFYFANNSIKAEEWFMWLLEYVLDNGELPDEQWYSNLKNKKFSINVYDKARMLLKLEDL